MALTVPPGSFGTWVNGEMSSIQCDSCSEAPRNSIMTTTPRAVQPPADAGPRCESEQRRRNPGHHQRGGYLSQPGADQLAHLAAAAPDRSAYPRPAPRPVAARIRPVPPAAMERWLSPQLIRAGAGGQHRICAI